MANAPTTPTAGEILHRFANLNTPAGAVHIGTVALRHGGMFTYCTGRHIAYAIGTPAEVTCKACIRKAAANGVDTTEL